jgi:hypothetical protein
MQAFVITAPARQILAGARLGVVALLLTAGLFAGLWAPSAAHAQRDGFVIGFGLGVGNTSLSIEGDDERVGRTSLMTDFRIGYAPTNRAMLYWSSDVSWFRLTGDFDDAVVISGTGGLGVTYFIGNAAPSPYVNATLGFNSFNYIGIEGAETNQWFGPGAAVGGGFEFARHWLLDGKVLLGRPRYSEFGDTETLRVRTFKVTLNYLHY